MLGRRSLLFALSLAAALIVAAPALAGGGGSGGSGSGRSFDSFREAEPPTDQIVLRLAPGASFDVASLEATAGMKLRRVRMRADGSYVIKLPNRRSLGLVQAITDKLSARGDVAAVEPDAMAHPLAVAPPNDPLWPQQWDMLAASSGFYGIDVLPAWAITAGSTGITVGVIDTGYLPHADLSGRFVSGYDFIADALVANDGDGRDADASDQGDSVSSAESASGYFRGCYPANSTWHGTHVSGTIGALADNGMGVAGINRISRIQPLRVLGKCGGYVSDIADAIRWAAGLPVTGVPPNPTPNRVVNISLGGSGACSSTYQSAIDAAVARGTVVVVAAGNSNANSANITPANCNNVITVAATGHSGKRAFYSNYGPLVEIAAPGGDSQLGKTILSTLNSGARTPAADSYSNYQGTSMATPHVVGVVSLMLSANPTLTPARVLSLLQSTVTKFPSSSGCTGSTSCGSGIVNAGTAVAAANAASGGGAGGGGVGGGVALPAPGGFAKTTPATLAQVTATSLGLQWEASADAATYEYCVDTTNDSQCTSPASWVSTGTATSATVSGLTADATYYWEVRATNATGTTLADSGAWWMFATQTPAAPPPTPPAPPPTPPTPPPSPPAPAPSTPPGVFVKLSPTSGRTGLSAPLTITWSASSGASSYEVCISRTSGLCGTWTSVTSTAATVSGLTSGTRYFWQIRARNANGTTDANGGTWWSFRMAW